MHTRPAVSSWLIPLKNPLLATLDRKDWKPKRSSASRQHLFPRIRVFLDFVSSIFQGWLERKAGPLHKKPGIARIAFPEAAKCAKNSWSTTMSYKRRRKRSMARCDGSSLFGETSDYPRGAELEIV